MNVDELEIYTGQYLQVVADSLLAWARENQTIVARPHAPVRFLVTHDSGGWGQTEFEMDPDEWEPNRRLETTRARAELMAAQDQHDLDIFQVFVTWCSDEPDDPCFERWAIAVVGVDENGEFAARQFRKGRYGSCLDSDCAEYSYSTVDGGPPLEGQPTYRPYERLADCKSAWVPVVYALHEFLDTYRSAKAEMSAARVSSAQGAQTTE